MISSILVWSRIYLTVSLPLFIISSTILSMLLCVVRTVCTILVFTVQSYCRGTNWQKPFLFKYKGYCLIFHYVSRLLKSDPPSCFSINNWNLIPIVSHDISFPLQLSVPYHRFSRPQLVQSYKILFVFSILIFRRTFTFFCEHEETFSTSKTILQDVFHLFWFPLSPIIIY